ncbi:MAG: hypothetical protein P8M09_00920 [Paracoccaceae bacterium]|nr:hypothetical protein [Paracoccaceae bacterium]
MSQEQNIHSNINKAKMAGPEMVSPGQNFQFLQSEQRVQNQAVIQLSYTDQLPAEKFRLSSLIILKLKIVISLIPRYKILNKDV